MIESKLSSAPGDPSILGASKARTGINFAFVSSHSEQAEIHLFYPDEPEPFFIASLSSHEHKADHVWHAYIENLQEPFEYSYKVLTDSNWSPLLLDPYARALVSSNKWQQETTYPNRARFFSDPSFDWQGVEKIKRPFKDWVIYEMHVRGFTKHPSSKVKHPGTFLGIIEKIPHLKKLGVNAVELLPVFEFNESEVSFESPEGKSPLCNFWGYSHVSFFCPMQCYAASDHWQAPILEFKEMVRELHRNGIAVILDVVYNHTAEKGEGGPVFSFKGLDKQVYYLLNSNGEYYNFSGTGNSVNCNHPVVSRLILDSLIYWAQDMQVDGFRFDLAPILTRSEDGGPMEDPPLIRAIEQEPLLEGVQMIAEAWDAAGLYQVGSFPGVRNWSEWNGKYRDIVRNYIKGSEGAIGCFARALCGSEDLYSSFSPQRSVNFVIAHDGYTLNDLVSYQEKHNWDNGEDNQDGNDNNISWNCGEEGESECSGVVSLRTRQVKNFVVSLMLSLGVPMIFMGDEYRHTRRGNNNPYCQDNELNWFLWDRLKGQEESIRFLTQMIRFRDRYKEVFCRETFLTENDISWHGEKAFHAEWGSGKKLLSFVIQHPETQVRFLISFNPQNQFVLQQVPVLKDQKWAQVVNTGLQSPFDFMENDDTQPIFDRSYLLSPYSVLIARAFSI